MVEFGFDVLAAEKVRVGGNDPGRGLDPSEPRPMTRDEVESPLALSPVHGKFLGDGDRQANEIVGAGVYERAGRWRVGVVRFRTGRRPRPPGPRGTGPRAELSLVPG